jgi:hypothetical protein
MTRGIKLSRRFAFGIIRPASSSSSRFMGIPVAWVSLNYLLAASIILLLLSSSICGAADLQENIFKLTPTLVDNKVSTVNINIASANGGPKINSLQVNYPKATILLAAVTLAGKSGYYRLELMENGKPTLAISVKDGKTGIGNGRVGVNASGAIQYRVTAINAQDVTIEIFFTEVKDNTDSAKVIEQEDDRQTPSHSDLHLSFACKPGENCNLTIQNKSKVKAYHNMAFQIRYKTTTDQGEKEIVKNGVIEDILMPKTTDDWPIALVFAKVPKDLRVSLSDAEAVKPSAKSVAKETVKKGKQQPPAEKVAIAKDTTPPPPPNIPAAKLQEPPPPIKEKELETLRFYESKSSAVIPYDKRIYKNEFIASKSNFINWELNFQHSIPAKKVEYDIEAVWTRSEDKVVYRQKLHAIIDPAKKLPPASSLWGNADDGKAWKPGIYVVELFVNGQKIADGSFYMN